MITAALLPPYLRDTIQSVYNIRTLFMTNVVIVTGTGTSVTA